jgi:hypothetical protein
MQNPINRLSELEVEVTKLQIQGRGS